MKNILFLLIPLIFNSCQTSQKKISTINQVGEELFYIIDNIHNMSYEEYIKYFLTRQEVISIFEESEFSDDGKTNKMYQYHLKQSDTEYFSDVKISKDYFIDYQDYITSLKEKGRFKFKDFIPRNMKEEGIELYTSDMEIEIISSWDNNDVEMISCLFIVHNEIFYLLGFD